jgi:hypothetical protein
MHASSGIQTHDPSNEAVKTYALGREATVTGLQFLFVTKLLAI